MRSKTARKCESRPACVEQWKDEVWSEGRRRQQPALMSNTSAGNKADGHEVRCTVAATREKKRREAEAEAEASAGKMSKSRVVAK